MNSTNQIKKMQIQIYAQLNKYDKQAQLKMKELVNFIYRMFI